MDYSKRDLLSPKTKPKKNLRWNLKEKVQVQHLRTLVSAKILKTTAMTHSPKVVKQRTKNKVLEEALKRTPSWHPQSLRNKIKLENVEKLIISDTFILGSKIKFVFTTAIANCMNKSRLISLGWTSTAKLLLTNRAANGNIFYSKSKRIPISRNSWRTK